MDTVTVQIPSLGDKFKDYRDDIPGDSYNWGPKINAKDIDGFAFHHSVTKQTAKVDGNWKAECDKIANLHIGQGWDGVGYRFIICSDGTVAYVGDLSHGGSAVADNNNHLFSACFIGDFTKELPTAAQIHSAHLLAKHFLEEMPAYPNLSSWDQIKGHRDFNQTTCPSPAWRDPGDPLRNRIIEDNWKGYPNPQPSSVAPAPQPTPQPVPQPVPPVDHTECEKKLKTANETIAQKDATIVGLNNKISGLETSLKTKEEKIAKAKVDLA